MFHEKLKPAKEKLSYSKFNLWNWLMFCCNEVSAFPCPESKLALGCSQFITFCCGFDRPHKEDIELGCKLGTLFCCIVATYWIWKRNWMILYIKKILVSIKNLNKQSNPIEYHRIFSLIQTRDKNKFKHTRTYLN